MTHFLDHRPFDASRQESVTFVSILSQIYYTADLAQAIVAQVGAQPGSDSDDAAANQGIPLGEINWAVAAVEFWPRVLKIAADQLLLRTLFQRVVVDRKSSAYRDRLNELGRPQPASVAGGDDVADGPLTARSLLDESTWDLIGRFIREHALDGEHHAALLDLLGAGQPVVGAAPEQRLQVLMELLKASEVAVQTPPILRAILYVYSIEQVSQSAEAVYLLDAAINLRTYLDSRSEGDRLDDYLLANGNVFLDRDRVKQALRQLLMKKLALTVRGEEKTGKSFVFELVHHVSGEKQLKLARATPDDATSAKDLIGFLAMQVDSELGEFAGPSDPTKWISHASYWLIDQAKKRGRWWFVLDGFAEKRLNSELRDTINRLAYNAWHKQDAGVRLVLLDYDGALPPELGVLREDEELKVLEPRHLNEFFVRFFTGRPGMDVATIKQCVEDSVAGVLSGVEGKEREQQRALAEAGADETVERKAMMQLVQEEVREVIRQYA